MPVSRRKLFSLRATVGYIVFAAAWILLSDRVLEMLADPHSVARFSTYKGLAFIAVTSAMLWVTLQNAPSDSDTYLGSTDAPRLSYMQLMWGLLTPAIATAIQWGAWEHIVPYVWILYYPAVFIAAWLGGAPAGLLATLTSTLVGWYVLVPPRMSWQIDKAAPVIAICIFLAVNVLVSLVMGWMRRGEQRSDNNKFQALVEQSLAGIYIVQGEAFRYVNPAFARMLGYGEPGQIIDSIAVSQIVSPGDVDRVMGFMRKSLGESMREVRFGFTGLRRDGSPVELDVHGRELQTTSGRVTIGLVLDVSEQRRTEAALRQSETLLRAVIEGTTDAVFVKDLDGRYLMANPAAAAMAGLSVEQVIGRDDHALFDADSAAQIRQADLSVLQSDASSIHEESLVFQTGEHRIFHVSKGPIKDEQGRQVGLFGLSRDITERVVARNALSEKQALLDNMSRLAKVGGWSLDVRTMRGTRTDGAARILDLDPSRPESLSIEDGMIYFQGEHRSRLTHAMRRAIEQGEPYALELELLSAKGVCKWIRTQGTPVWENGQVIRIDGAIQDISEVQQAREALQAYQARLEQTVQERTAQLEAARQEAERLAHIKSEFLANMSHEIRTPLNGVLGLAQIGSRDHTGAARQVFEQINASGRLLLGILNDILDFSKIEAGKLNIDMQPVDLRQLLNHAMELVRELAEDKGLALLVSVDETLPKQCLCDGLRLEQIMLNLLSNAVKFTGQGLVQVSAQARQGRLILTVSDTGIGMTAAQIDGLFRPFEQADGSTTRQYGGTGLGLAISKRLVEMLDGHIHVSSEPGHGTHFEVDLPLLDAGVQAHALADSFMPAVTQEVSKAEAAPTAPASRQTRLAGLRILAAEDNVVNQMVLGELLAYEGAVVTMSDSGEAAMRELTQRGAKAFDIVLMDIQMPLMDGYEATRRIKAIAPMLPVIGQTAHAMSEEHAKCHAAGMVDLVVKPIELETLVRTLLRHAPQTTTA